MQNYIIFLRGYVGKRESLAIRQSFRNKFGHIDLNFIQQLSKKIDAKNIKTL